VLKVLANINNYFIFASGFTKRYMRSACPLNYGLEIFGDKWTLLIIRDLMFFNKRYYNEFLASKEGISTNVLADRLTLLENMLFISKKKDNEHKQRILYSLTEKGIDLLPLIIDIGLWSDKYAGDALQKEDKEGILGEVRFNKEKGLQERRNKLLAEHVNF
jgi:DNA-binding HxlR family transcriptional regulator